jgi:hypothetical protein
MSAHESREPRRGSLRDRNSSSRDEGRLRFHGDATAQSEPTGSAASRLYSRDKQRGRIAGPFAFLSHAGLSPHVEVALPADLVSAVYGVPVGLNDLPVGCAALADIDRGAIHQGLEPGRLAVRDASAHDRPASVLRRRHRHLPC